ncbi:MAG TPA: hypothetical protein PKL94_11710 [Saprospiraceae bacterium]|nr:hypothetical protein [Saprospiraceae bacterium]
MSSLWDFGFLRIFKEIRTIHHSPFTTHHLPFTTYQSRVRDRSRHEVRRIARPDRGTPT